MAWPPSAGVPTGSPWSPGEVMGWIEWPLDFSESSSWCLGGDGDVGAANLGELRMINLGLTIH